MKNRRSYPFLHRIFHHIVTCWTKSDKKNNKKHVSLCFYITIRYSFLQVKPQVTWNPITMFAPISANKTMASSGQSLFNVQWRFFPRFSRKYVTARLSAWSHCFTNFPHFSDGRLNLCFYHHKLMGLTISTPTSHYTASCLSVQVLN